MLNRKLLKNIWQKTAYLTILPVSFALINTPSQAYTTETLVAQSSNSITCESDKGNRKRCRFDAPNGVELVETLSNGSCRGKWAYDQRRQYIEVWDGCRARFEASRYGNNNNNNNNSDTIVCGSSSGKTQRCNFNGGERVELVRTLSNGTCKGNWRYDQRRRYIEVKNGCRGEFRGDRYFGGSGSSHDNSFGASGGSGNNSNNSRRIVCESEKGKSQRCSFDTRNGVRLSEQLSSASCRGNWFSGRGFVEVKNGCRGVFESERGNSVSNSEYDKGYEDARRGRRYDNRNNTQAYDEGYRDGRR